MQFEVLSVKLDTTAGNFSFVGDIFDRERSFESIAILTELHAEHLQSLTVIGWHECISLPDLGLNDFAVKVDTGAKTTALHADNIEIFKKDGAQWVRFQTPSIAGAPSRTCECPVVTKRDITNTSGAPQTRVIIRTPMKLAGRKWKIDISLTDRGLMRFPLILGRRALRHKNIVVHPGRSYLVSTKPNFGGPRI